MESEISNFIMVWSSVFLSVCYCYGVAKVVPKGTIRLFLFLPVLCLFFILPLNLNSVNLGTPTVFFITWLATFKLLLLVFDNGPLSDPSLSMFHFVFITCFPVIPQQCTNPESSSIKQENPPKKTRNKDNLKKNVVGLRSPLHFAKKGLILLFLIGLGSFKDKIPGDIVLFLICMFIYIGLDVMLGVVAIIGQILLQTEFELAFNDPFLSTSLQDFWGHRWNRVTSTTLRAAVFRPTFYHVNQAVGQKCAAALALMGSFLVSALMHEILFYYLGRVRPTWSTTLFFFIHGILLIVESVVKNKVDAKWQLPPVIIGPLIFVFVICTFMWMPLQELLEYDVDKRALEEYAAVGVFVMDLSKAFCDVGHLILHSFQPSSTK
ncbi:hypothetical protein ACJIZ3_006701 [Penstemon smallii]|uniref:Wax synthase domain-containing protein n=1 Tax=Penstemon smallii TaxID=265156 RepID=A0ABD3S8P6_9LAMI